MPKKRKKSEGNSEQSTQVKPPKKPKASKGAAARSFTNGLSDKDIGLSMAWVRILNLQPYSSYKGIASNEYVEGFDAAYNEIYKGFEAERDDSDLSQLAFLLGRYHKTKKNIAVPKPKNISAPLFRHWGEYMKGFESAHYIGPNPTESICIVPNRTKPIRKNKSNKQEIVEEWNELREVENLKFEVQGVESLFSLTLESKACEVGRNLAAEDYILGNAKKTSEELQKINADMGFTHSYTTVFQEFAKGYTEETACMRRGNIFSLKPSIKNKDARLAGAKYALYEFMRDNHLNKLPDTDFLATFFAKKDAAALLLPFQTTMSTAFKAKYFEQYEAALIDIESKGAEAKNAVQFLRKYKAIQDESMSPELKLKIRQAKKLAEGKVRGNYAFNPSKEKIAANDPVEITLCFYYYRISFLYGEKYHKDYKIYQGKCSGKISAENGAVLDAARIEKLAKQGEDYLKAYLKSYEETRASLTVEQVAYQRFYIRGRNKAINYINKLNLALDESEFDKKDPLYLLKKEACFEGFLNGLDTREGKFDENIKAMVRKSIVQQLNAIYQNPLRKIFPNITKMRDSVIDENLAPPSVENSVRVAEVAVLNGEKGLFACRTIKPNEYFIEYAGEIKLKEAAEGSIFAVSLDDKRVVDGAKGNAAKYANDSWNPNAQLVVVIDDMIMIKSLETIELGQQILIKYGPNYPLKNSIGLNPWDSEATSQIVYDTNKTHYSPAPYFFDEKCAKQWGLPKVGPYLIPQLMKAIIEKDNRVFRNELKNKALELPLLIIEDQPSTLIFSDANINYYFNALMLACFLGSTTYAIKLLDAGARGNVLQRNNGSLFHMVFQGNGTEKEKIELTLLLLERGVNPFVISNQDISFLSLMDKAIASKQLKLSVLEKLDPKEALLFSCYAGVTAFVEFLVKNNQRFELGCLIEGKQDADFRNKVVNFLKYLSSSDKKLFDALLGYPTLYASNKRSASAFFQSPKDIEILNTKPLQSFNDISEKEFNDFYLFLQNAGMFDCSAALKEDLDITKLQFENLSFTESQDSHELLEDSEDIEMWDEEDESNLFQSGFSPFN